uniref:Uncharacterized protein n=1 Tax=Utricularia reniformis TaxID=192314 RepID=A0A1Y0B1N8_9LAMI|nr:hypothetical protein AEK19_MT1151 [Utricularia reniformis]ART31365.1 hypothetical protein AEK19_MT1151 [Utricularia reniformis]
MLWKRAAFGSSYWYRPTSLVPDGQIGMNILKREGILSKKR